MNWQSISEDLSKLVQSENGCQYTDIDDGILRRNACNWLM